ncbi:NF-X1-type zinc finger protein NFXL1-like [Oncorhynchus clarkii lewisi]
MTRQRCHCKISLLYIDCLTFRSAEDETKADLGSCKNQCPKQLSCGHHCKDLCHPGHCEDKCSHRVKLKCPCKRIKKELLCYKARQDQTQVDCNDACTALRRKANEVKEAEENAALEEERKKQQAELEAFENRQKGRRKKRGKRGEEEEEAEGGWRRYRVVMVSLGGVLLAAVAFYLIQMD